MHECANPKNKESLCIEPSHQYQADHATNMATKTCHTDIRAYFNIARNRKDKVGPFYVKDVPIAFRARLTKKKEQGLIEEIECPHTDKPCFIQWPNIGSVVIDFDDIDIANFDLDAFYKLFAMN